MKIVKGNNSSIKEMSRDEIARRYNPLVCKIAWQISESSGYDFNECKSAGNVGLVYAMDHYDESKQEGKKKQTFLQYAGYMIRFYILNDMNSNGHTIRVNQDQQKRIKAEGGSVELTLSLDKKMSAAANREDCTFSDLVKGDDESSIYMSLDPSEEEMWKEVFDKLKGVFNERDLDIFFSTFGVNGYEEKDGKEMAIKYGISAGAITQVRNKILKYMKENKELRECLVSILQMSTRENYM